MKVDPKILEDEKIIVRYYRTPEHGSVTVCGRFYVANKRRKFAIGVAFCSPTEKQFDKQLGKTIALGRLMRRRSRGYAWTTTKADENVEALIFHLLCSLQDPEGAERTREPKLQSARWFPAFLKEMLMLRKNRDKQAEKESEAKASE